MLFMRPTFERPYCAIGMSASLRIAQGMLVAHSNSSPRCAIDELVQVAQVLQQLPALRERRRNQLDQRLRVVSRDVLVGQR